MSKKELIAQIFARRGQGGAMCTCVPFEPAARAGGALAAASSKPESAAEHIRIDSSGAPRAD